MIPLPKHKMLSQIEILREQLNKHVEGNSVCKDSHTIALSKKLDRLILWYTKQYNT